MSCADPAAPAPGDRAAVWVVAAGVCAALHVGKVPPAIPALQQATGMSLVQAGFLLSLVQAAGMAAGLAFGALADGLGLRRSLLIGLMLLSAASAAGALAHGPAALMLLRAAEGMGFLLVVLAAPGLIRRLVAPQRLARAMGVWGGYMPLATALAMLVGPLVIDGAGWRWWWAALAALTLVMAIVLARRLDPARAAAPRLDLRRWQGGLRDTLRSPRPWLLAACFGCYSGQWLAVVGFLPTIYREAGASTLAGGVLTALAVAANVLGNVGSGRALHRGVPAVRLLTIGFCAMALAALLAFAALGQGAVLRYLAVVGFSMLGGIVPGTLFALVVRAAPGEHAISTTVGWMQQWSSFGQFAGPPLVAAMAGWAGGWHWTWAATGTAALAGLVLARQVARW